MRLRLLFILSLFVSVVAIIWAYTYVDNDINNTGKSVWEQTIADLKVCSDIKNAKSGVYETFADIADKEQQPDAAGLFHALACSERIHRDNCVKALRRLGSIDTLNTHRSQAASGGTSENIARSIEIEENVRNTYRSGMIDRAIDNHNRHAATVMAWLAAGDMKHLILLEQLRKRSDKAKADSGYAVCPRCGNIYYSDMCDIYCPFCMTKGTEFILFR